MAKVKKDPLAGLPKRHRENVRVRTDEAFAPADAVAKLKQFKAPKFDQTVEVVLHLGIDPKQADQALRGAVALPKGIGKAKKVIAFCPSDQVAACTQAAAIKAGGEDLMSEVEKGFMDFDVAVATPDMMRVIAKLGKVLGPKDSCPRPRLARSPRTSSKPSASSRRARSSTATTRPATSTPIGKMSFKPEDLAENLEAFIKVIEGAKPSTVKGQYIKKIAISGTMTPSVLVQIPQAAVAV